MRENLDNILNSETKIKIMRLFISYKEGYHASGREIARLLKTTAPTAHTALKELYSHHILNYEISGKTHLYSLNRKSRMVLDLLFPMFQKEHAVKKDIFNFLKNILKKKGVTSRIASMLFYGSHQSGKANESSDVDIAIIVRRKKDLEIVEDIFFKDIHFPFYDYFGTSLDAYIKTKKEFINRLRKGQSPVSTLMKSYTVILGEDPISWK